MKEVRMKLILIVLAIKFIMELLTKKKTGNKKTIDNTVVDKTQHPAEYALR
jgi:hypothetical protein